MVYNTSVPIGPCIVSMMVLAVALFGPCQSVSLPGVTTVEKLVDHILQADKFGLYDSLKLKNSNHNFLLTGHISLANGTLRGLNIVSKVPGSMQIEQQDNNSTRATADIYFNSLQASYQSYSVVTLLFSEKNGSAVISSNATVRLHLVFSGKYQCDVKLEKVQIIKFHNFDVTFKSPTSWWNNISKIILNGIFDVFNTWIKDDVKNILADRLGEATNLTIPFYNWECRDRAII